MNWYSSVLSLQQAVLFIMQRNVHWAVYAATRYPLSPSVPELPLPGVLLLQTRLMLESQSRQTRTLQPQPSPNKTTSQAPELG